MAICDKPMAAEAAIDKVWEGLVELVTNYDPGLRSHLADWSRNELEKIPPEPPRALLGVLTSIDQIPTDEQRAMRPILLSLQKTLGKE